MRDTSQIPTNSRKFYSGGLNHRPQGAERVPVRLRKFIHKFNYDGALYFNREEGYDCQHSTIYAAARIMGLTVQQAKDSVDEKEICAYRSLVRIKHLLRKRTVDSDDI